MLQNGDVCLVDGLSGIYFNGQITLCNMTVTDHEPDYVLRFDGQHTIEPDPGSSFPELEIGSNGMFVAILQICLKYHGIRIDPDGSFGTLTYAALRQFREQHYLSGDTVCDAATWQKLLTE